MSWFKYLFTKPALRCDIEGVAQTQDVTSLSDSKEKPTISVSVQEVTGYTVKSKTKLFDRWLDAVVHAAGSAPVFFIIIAGLFTWALLGIRFGTYLEWKALISDVQAILCYVFDSFLMRQLLNAYEEDRLAAAEIRSRLISHTRMLVKLKARLGSKEIGRLLQNLDVQLETADFEAFLKKLGLFERGIISSSKILGHIATVGLYLVCIFIWLGFGHHCGWTNTWQLYINSATSALMVFVFAC